MPEISALSQQVQDVTYVGDECSSESDDVAFRLGGLDSERALVATSADEWPRCPDFPQEIVLLHYGKCINDQFGESKRITHLASIGHSVVVTLNPWLDHVDVRQVREPFRQLLHDVGESGFGVRHPHFYI